MKKNNCFYLNNKSLKIMNVYNYHNCTFQQHQIQSQEQPKESKCAKLLAYLGIRYIIEFITNAFDYLDQQKPRYASTQRGLFCCLFLFSLFQFTSTLVTILIPKTYSTHIVHYPDREFSFLRPMYNLISQKTENMCDRNLDTDLSTLENIQYAPYRNEVQYDSLASVCC